MSHPSRALQYAIKFAQDALSPQINPPPAGGGVGPLASLPLGSGGGISPEHLALLRSAGNPQTPASVSPYDSGGGISTEHLDILRNAGRDIADQQASPAPGSPGHEVWNMGDPSVGSLEDVAPTSMAGGQLPAWAQPATTADAAPSTWAKGQTAPAWGAYDPGEAPTSADSPAKKLDKMSAYLAEHMFLPELLGMQKAASGLPREQDRLAMAMAFGSALAEQDLAPLRKLAMKVSVDLMTKRAQDISPEVAHALLGGGLGAAAGGLAGYGLSDKKNRGRNALLAAIVGGAGGAAAGHHFSDQLPDVTGTRGEGGGVSKALGKFRERSEGAKAGLRERGLSRMHENLAQGKALSERAGAQDRATQSLQGAVGRTRAAGSAARTIRQAGEGQASMRQGLNQVSDIHRTRSPEETAAGRAALSQIMGRGIAEREGVEALRAGAIPSIAEEARTPPEGLPTPGVGLERARVDLREMSPETLEREQVDLSPGGTPMSAQRGFEAEADQRSQALMEEAARRGIATGYHMRPSSAETGPDADALRRLLSLYGSGQ